MKRIKDEKYKSLNRTKFSMEGMVLIFSLIATILSGFFSYFVLKKHEYTAVNQERQKLADEITQDIVYTIAKYPCYEWLFTYWYEHRDSMDVQYNETIVTVEKAKKLTAKHPGMIIEYLEPEELETYPEEDQRLYAEVVYDQIVGLMNYLKVIYEPAYLSIMVVEPDYSQKTYILSAASPGQVRGTDGRQAYVIGVVRESTQEQIDGMIKASKGGRSLIRMNDYVNSYGFVLDIMKGRHVMVDLVYDVSGLEDDVESRVLGGMCLFIGLQIVLAAVLVLMVFALAVRPIGRIQRNVWIYREDKDSEKVLKSLRSVKTGNELEALAGDISDMIVSIDQYVDEIKHITADREKIAAELGVAKKIQSGMLPSDFPAFPDRKEFDLYAKMTPAKEVGGDFYDFFLVDEDHLALVVADVSGKGIPAALFMAEARTRIQSAALPGKSPKEILSVVNHYLSIGNKAGFFVTVWIAIMDLRNGKGMVCNAGHEHPIIRHAGGEYEAVIYRHSPAVGVADGIPYKEHEFQMLPGDRIFVYTDGVPEATSRKKELYGLDRLLAAMNAHPEDTLQELFPHVQEDIDTFVDGAVQFDDITMLGFDYYGTEGMRQSEDGPQQDDEPNAAAYADQTEADYKEFMPFAQE